MPDFVVVKQRKTSLFSTVATDISHPKETIRRNRTFAKFLLVGFGGTGQHISLLILLRDLLDNLLISNGVAIEASIINNFLWNDRYTFGHLTRAQDASSGGGVTAVGLRRKLDRLWKFNVTSLIGLAVNEAVLYFLGMLEEAMGLKQSVVLLVLSSLIAIITAFVVNYVGSSRWAWHTARSSPKA